MCALAVNEVSKRSDAASTTISLTGVSKAFENGTTALSDVSLSFRAGEFVSLLGASGCGKSTLLRLIAGLSEPSTGNVEWHDRGQRDEHPLGYVFQDPTLMPWASVFSNVWLPLRLSGMARKDAQDQVMEALELVGLAEQVEQRPNELSGGMKMRVSIARALVTRPKVLLLDEPFAALDEITRFKLNDDLLSLWERFGWTIVFVTHSVFEAVYLSNRILVMGANPGRIVHDVCVKLPQSRTEIMRMTPEYSVECDKISQLLKSS